MPDSQAAIHEMKDKTIKKMTEENTAKSIENKEISSGVQATSDLQKSLIETEDQPEERELNGEVEVEISKSTDNGMPESTQVIEPTVEFHVNVDRVSAVTMNVPMLMQGNKLKAVVDTGAEVTISSERVYNSLPDKCKLPLEQAETKLVVAEADKSMRTEGVVNPKFIIGDKEVEWPMYVAPIQDDILLGCDFLDMKDITVSTKRGLEMDGKWIDCIIERKHTLARVCIKRSLTMPTNSEFVVSSKVDDMNLVGTRYGMMEPTLEDSRGIIVARSLIDT